MIDRRPVGERCQAKALRGPNLEEVVWGDIERFLRDPGEILEELTREMESDPGSAIVEAERLTLEAALARLVQRRKKAIALNLRDTMTDAELDEELVEVNRERAGVEARLSELTTVSTEPESQPDDDLLVELSRRLDEGLDEAQMQEVVGLLVKRITVHTELLDKGKQAKVLIEYRFPAVVNDSTGMDSSPPAA